MLFCRQTETVVTQRVKNVVSLHALEAAKNIGADVAKWVANVKPRTRWIREHVQHKEFFATRNFGRIRERTGGVGCMKRAFCIPGVLPAGFNVGR